MNRIDEKICIRPAVESDRRFLYEVFESACDEGIRALAEPMRSQLIEMQFQAQRQTYSASFPDAVDQIIEFEDCAVGRIYTDESDDCIHIVDVALLTQWRGRGIGFTLLSWLTNSASEKQKSVSLRVRKDNPAVGLYKKLGFTYSGEDNFYYEMIWQS